MSKKIAVSAFCMLVLAACEPHSSTPSGSVLFEDDVVLVRGAKLDEARREIQVDSAALLVAIVDENLTDVRVRLAVDDDKSVVPVEVENHLAGSGTEVAALEVPRSARVIVTLTGPQNSTQPGAVHVRIRQFSRDAADNAGVAMGLTAWSAATAADARIDAIRSAGLAQIQRAVTNLGAPAGDPGLAAEARLIRANMLEYFALDAREARAEAGRAAHAFETLPQPSALNAARAALVEARALSQISEAQDAVNPTAEEALGQAQRILAELVAPTSPFGPIERARAIDGIARLESNSALMDDSDRHFAEARALYRSAGYTAGEVEMTASLANNLLLRGRFSDATAAYDDVLPQVDKITNPRRRVFVYVSAAAGQAQTGRPDEAVTHLLKAVEEARVFGLREVEGSAAQELGYLYFFRGDYLQARAFMARALQITREDRDILGLSFTLQSAGMVARQEGDYATAIAMHEEAARISTNPIARMRALLQLAQDFTAAGRYPEAITQTRAALAVKLQDPRHNAYNDVRRTLAELLIEHGDGSRVTMTEAQLLLADSLQQSIELQDRNREISGRRVRAQLLAKQGKFAAAQAEYQRTFELIFAYRGTSANPQLRSFALREEQPAFRGYFDLMMRDVVADGATRPRPVTAREAEALRMLERARETHFGALHTGPADAATTARIDALLAQMADRSFKMARMHKRSLTPQETAELETLQLDMSRLRVELDHERTALADKQAAGKPLSASARKWRAVDPGAVQLSFALGNRHAYVWVRDRHTTSVAVLSDAPDDLERALAELAALDPQTSAEQIEASLTHLSSVLLPAGLLPADTNSVQIVAEGRIAGVPFSGLRSPADPTRRLVETHAISMITSLFAIETSPRPAQPRPLRLVALASGSGTLRSAAKADPKPKLQAAVAEIRAVGALFEAQDPDARIKLLAGNDGSADALRGTWAGGADVVHFATHALADLRQPLASLLVLPANDASGAPTYLTAGQVEGWRGDADLVFLSACESAIGPPRFAGGMPGLQSAFLRAGARVVIATLWPIEDVLAREFSVDFYRRLTRGESAAQALSETQREWLTPTPRASPSEQLRRRITAMAHAYFAI